MSAANYADNVRLCVTRADVWGVVATVAILVLVLHGSAWLFGDAVGMGVLLLGWSAIFAHWAYQWRRQRTAADTASPHRGSVRARTEGAMSAESYSQATRADTETLAPPQKKREF